MIIGGSKKQVIENIEQAVLDNDLNRKVEEGDAELSPEEEKKIIEKFFVAREKKSFSLN